ncbi:MAG: hypothetical protein AAGL68_00995 [Pseudomonadota bacterium]
MSFQIKTSIRIERSAKRAVEIPLVSSKRVSTSLDTNGNPK